MNTTNLQILCQVKILENLRRNQKSDINILPLPKCIKDALTSRFIYKSFQNNIIKGILYARAVRLQPDKISHAVSIALAKGDKNAKEFYEILKYAREFFQDIELFDIRDRHAIAMSFFIWYTTNKVMEMNNA